MPAELAPKPGAPSPTFSPGILVDGTLYISGQIGVDRTTRQIPDSIEEELKNTMEGVGLVLKEAGMSFKDVVSVTIFLTDMSLAQRLNAAYVTYFSDPRPARALAGVSVLGLPKARIEISVIAKK